MRIKLGDLVKDRITHYRGIAVCRTEWLNGCARVGVQSQQLKDGIPQEPQHFDEAQLDVLGPDQPSATKITGGPTPAPRRNPDPAGI